METKCKECNGTGYVTLLVSQASCEACEGTGRQTLEGYFKCPDGQVADVLEGRIRMPYLTREVKYSTPSMPRGEFMRLSDVPKPGWPEEVYRRFEELDEVDVYDSVHRPRGLTMRLEGGGFDIVCNATRGRGAVPIQFKTTTGWGRLGKFRIVYYTPQGPPFKDILLEVVRELCRKGASHGEG